MKKVGKTTSQLRYDLNQTPYDFTVEVTNRYKGLDLVDKSEGRTMDKGSEHCTGGNDLNHPKKQEMQEGKVVV